MGLRFNILGSFEVYDGDRQVELGGFKQRAVLAVLVLEANRVVAVDRLIDELWGERPPRAALTALQTYISNLRRALEPDRAPREPARVLRSQPPGYLLAVDDDDGVDAARFERLAGHGRDLLREARPDRARDALAEGLALWRGPALGEFADETWGRAHGARLEERRLVALEDRIAAELALGEHASAIGELQALVEAEPLREQLWSHLILALYRSGRQADALAAYRACRQALDEELGIEPGTALRRLELAILQQSAELDWAPPVPPPHEPDDGAPAGAYLAYRDGDGRDRLRALEPAESPISIGRGPSARLSLPWDGRVSRSHARLERRDEGWVLVDTSRHGSFVNDERVEGSRKLSDGDELRFGDTILTYREPATATVPETLLA